MVGNNGLIAWQSDLWSDDTRSEDLSARLSIERARDLARTWAKGVPEGQRSDHAALFVRQALEALARQISPSFVLSPPLFESVDRLDKVITGLAEMIGAEASRLPLSEALHILTSIYPSLLPSGERGALGAYYTPPGLVSRLFDMTEDLQDWQRSRVLDPAVGGGAFLIQAALRMRRAIQNSEPAFVLSQLGTRLVGFELDHRAGSLAQSAFEILLSDLALASGRSVPVVVRICDTLDVPAEPIFDLVIGNPPYGRVALSPEHRSRYSRSLYGHANLYGVFTDAALRWAKSGGHIAYLTPTSFLAGRYYSALRGLLAKEAPPIVIDFVHARAGIFEDVLQETLLAVYAKGRPSLPTQIHYLTLSNENETALVRNGTVELPKPATSPWLAPRHAEHSALIAHAKAMKSRLLDWGYSVSTGPLVWNRFKSQLRTNPNGKDVYPLLWAECITPTGEFIYRASKKNHQPFFKLESGDDWLLTNKPCVLVQRTTAKEQARRIIAAELPASFINEHRGVVVENHVNMVRAIDDVKVAPKVVAALLNSRVLDQVFRCISGSVAVSAYELEALPLPEIGELETLCRLVNFDASRDDIDAECTRLYGASV